METLKNIKVRSALNRTNKDIEKSLKKANTNKKVGVNETLLRDKVKRQDEFVESHLIRCSKEANLKGFKAAIELAIEDKEVVVKYGQGMYVLEHAKAEFQLGMFYYKRVYKNEIYLKAALVRDGLSQDDLIALVRGEYTADYDLLRSLKPDGN